LKKRVNPWTVISTRKVLMEDFSPYFIAFAVFVFGLLIGSFLNVVIYRLPLGERQPCAGG
jgi:hypothetical protein